MGAAIILAATLCAGQVQAFSLRPAIQEFVVDPGDKVQSYVEVTNDEDVAQDFYLSVQKFVPKGASGQQDFLPLSDVEGLPSWIYFSAPKYQLKAGETRQIPFDLKVPGEANGGGYYAAIFVSNQPPVLTGKQSAMGSRTGSLIFLTVRGLIVSQAEITHFLAQSQANVAQAEVRFDLSIRNTGNIHLQPSGYLRITDWWGQSVAKIKINPEGARILPSSSRYFSATWKEGNWFAFGKYQVTYESEGQNVSGITATEFQLAPRKSLLMAIGGGLLGLVVLGLVVSWVRKRKKASKVPESSKAR